MLGKPTKAFETSAMKKISIGAVLIIVYLCIGFKLEADTLIFNSSAVISDVKIISIDFKKQFLIFERDGKRQLVKLDQLKEFFMGDVKVAFRDGSLDNSAEYSVSAEVDMPDFACEVESDRKFIKKKLTKTETIKANDCTVQWRINLKALGESNMVQVPLFYMFIVTSSSSKFPHSYKLYRFSFPDYAKMSSPLYDKSEIYTKLNNFKRPLVNYRPWGGALGKKRRFLQQSNFGEYRWIISLKEIGVERILAWHLEIWGKKGIVEKQDYIRTGLDLEPLWWQCLSIK